MALFKRSSESATAAPVDMDVAGVPAKQSTAVTSTKPTASSTPPATRRGTRSPRSASSTARTDMRIVAFLNRRYTPGQSAALLICALAVLLGAQLAAIGLGINQPVSAVASLTLSLAAYFGGAELIDRRTRG